MLWQAFCTAQHGAALQALLAMDCHSMHGKSVERCSWLQHSGLVRHTGAYASSTYNCYCCKATLLSRCSGGLWAAGHAVGPPGASAACCCAPRALAHAQVPASHGPAELITWHRYDEDVLMQAPRLPRHAGAGHDAERILGALKLAVAHSGPERAPAALAARAALGDGRSPATRALSIALLLADLASQVLHFRVFPIPGAQIGNATLLTRPEGCFETEQCASTLGA